MSAPTPNIFSNLEQFSNVLGIDNSLEGRFDNDGNGNPIYVGYSPTPNADPAEPIWSIFKLYYDGSNYLLRRQLPDDGIKFAYVWNDRATYFS